MKSIVKMIINNEIEKKHMGGGLYKCDVIWWGRSSSALQNVTMGGGGLKSQKLA